MCRSAACSVAANVTWSTSKATSLAIKSLPARTPNPCARSRLKAHRGPCSCSRSTQHPRAHPVQATLPSKHPQNTGSAIARQNHGHHMYWACDQHDPLTVGRIGIGGVADLCVREGNVQESWRGGERWEGFPTQTSTSFPTSILRVEGAAAVGNAAPFRPTPILAPSSSPVPT